MIVTARAVEGLPEPHRAVVSTRSAVYSGEELIGDDAALLVQHVIAVKAGGHFLVQRRPGRRSPASCSIVNWSKGLFSLKARMTQSRQARARGRGRPIAVRVGVAGRVEPVHRHAFAECGDFRSRSTTVFVGRARGVAEKGLDLGGSRRQAGEVERHRRISASFVASGAGESPSPRAGRGESGRDRRAATPFVSPREPEPTGPARATSAARSSHPLRSSA